MKTSGLNYYAYVQLLCFCVERKVLCEAKFKHTINKTNAYMCRRTYKFYVYIS